MKIDLERIYAYYKRMLKEEPSKYPDFVMKCYSDEGVLIFYIPDYVDAFDGIDELREFARLYDSGNVEFDWGSVDMPTDDVDGLISRFEGVLDPDFEFTDIDNIPPDLIIDDILCSAIDDCDEQIKESENLRDYVSYILYHESYYEVN